MIKDWRVHVPDQVSVCVCLFVCVWQAAQICAISCFGSWTKSGAYSNVKCLFAVLHVAGCWKGWARGREGQPTGLACVQTSITAGQMGWEKGDGRVTSQFIQKHEISVYTPTILKFKRCAMNVGMCDCVCVCTIITAVQWKNKYGAKSRLHTHTRSGTVTSHTPR